MKTKLIIAIATLAIVIGLYGLLTEVPAATATQVTETVAEENKIKVWFVRNDVKRGQLVERSDFSIRQLPESEANALGIADESSINLDKGSVYNRALTVESAVFPEYITATNDPEYIELVLAENRVPFAIKVDPDVIIGGVIGHGSYVDVLALASGGSKISFNSDELSQPQFKSISVSPVLIGVKVLKIQQGVMSGGQNNNDVTATVLVLELTRKQVAKLTVAKRIADLEVHKSIGSYKAADLTADAGDVLADYKAIKEFRANDISIN